MITIHRGRGGVVFIAGVVAALAMNAITNGLYDNEYYTAHIWPKFGALVLAGVLCTVAGAYLRKYPTKVKDKDWLRGESADHLLFIPVIYWGGIFIALGFMYAVISFLRTANG